MKPKRKKARLESPSPGKERRNPRGMDKLETKVTPIITYGGDPADPDYYIRRLDRNCNPRQKAVSIRSSTRWIDTFKTPNGGLSLPFIDQLGRFSGQTVYRWSCDPRSLITTVVSTISKRLVSYCRKHNPWHVVKRHLKPLVGAAAYYAFTKNSYFWDRILYFSRNLEKKGTLIHRFRLYFSSKWDDDKRFVYSQVIFQTNWLLSRALGPRDKSLFFFRERKRTIWRKPDDSPSRLALTDQVRNIAYAMSLI